MIINAEGRRVDELTGEGREGCGFGPCINSKERGGRGCTLCDHVAHLEQPRGLALVTEPAAPLLEEAGVELLPSATAPILELEAERPQVNPTRDGAPKLAGERERRHPMWNKRKRDGPHRGNA